MNVSIYILKYWKNHSSSGFNWGKRWWYSQYCPLNWLTSQTPLLSLFNFKWTFSEAIRAASSLVSSIIVIGLQSALIIGLHPTIPTSRQAAGRSVLTFGTRVRTWICLHYTCTLPHQWQNVSSFMMTTAPTLKLGQILFHLCLWCSWCKKSCCQIFRKCWVSC